MMRTMILAGVLLAMPAVAAPLTEVAKPADLALRAKPGTLLLLNVWATWCGPCVHEMDDLRALAEEFGPRGVEFVGLSLDDVLPGDRASSKRRVSGFLAKKAVRYRNLYYTGNQNALADALGFDGEIPITLVFDSAGRERLRVEGAIDRKQLTQRLGELSRTVRKTKGK